MQIDVRTLHGRYVVAHYGSGDVTVMDNDTQQTVTIPAARVPSRKEGFEALFATSDTIAGHLHNLEPLLRRTVHRWEEECATASGTLELVNEMQEMLRLVERRLLQHIGD
jgi:hypothetical protein